MCLVFTLRGWLSYNVKRELIGGCELGENIGRGKKTCIWILSSFLLRVPIKPKGTPRETPPTFSGIFMGWGAGGGILDEHSGPVLADGAAFDREAL